MLSMVTSTTTASQQTSQSLASKVTRTRCEVWTRVMGYHRPVSHFNIGKKSEHYSRSHFIESVAANSKFNQQYSS